MRVSIRQLAEHCGVSIGTVDRVLNSRPGVKEATRLRVEAAIKELGYSTNYVAKSLSIGKSMSIGVVLLHLNNSFFAQMSDAIVTEADSLGYFTYLTLSGKSADKELKCVKDLVARLSDGIILFSTNRDEGFAKYLSECGVPVVTVMTELPGIPKVRIDDYRAMADAARYIASKGYQRILYVSTPLSYKLTMNILVQEDRRDGFLSAVSDKNIDYTILDKPDYLGDIDAFDLKAKRTAILCSSDVYALAIMRHLRMRGLTTPYDYGLMGFDNINILRHIDPVPTTVSVPIEEVGRAAVRMLVRRINGEQIDGQILPHEIICGQTIIRQD